MQLVWLYLDLGTSVLQVASSLLEIHKKKMMMTAMIDFHIKTVPCGPASWRVSLVTFVIDCLFVTSRNTNHLLKLQTIRGIFLAEFSVSVDS